MAERDTVGHAARVGERLGALLAPLAEMPGVARGAPLRHHDRHRGGFARLAYRIRGLPAGPPARACCCGRCPTSSC